MEYDLLVLGAGIYGIQAARTYLEIHPKASVLIFESSKTIGGVWSAERNYKYFWTQIPVRMCQFSDRPMPEIEDNDLFFDLFPAKFVTSYLEYYLDSHIYNSRTLRSLIRTSMHVSNVEKRSGKWIITTAEHETYITQKLIDATGLTNIPSIPKISNMSQFQGIKLHSKDFGTSKVLEHNAVQHVVVIGGAKSAADIAYSAGKAGKNVSWVIRRSGAGPAVLVDAKGIGSHTNSSEDFYTRFVSTLTLSLFSPQTIWTQFLRQSFVGRFLLKKIWSLIDHQILSSANFDRGDAKMSGFANLKPDTSVFWENDSTGVNNRPDFFDIIANSVRVHRVDISHASMKALHLTDGTIIPADAIIYATGYSNSSPHYDRSLAAKLGLPILKSAEDAKVTQHWEELENKADHDVCAKFPLLKHPPPYHKQETSQTPFRLYRGILPIIDHDIVLVGKVGAGNHFRIAEAQALWAVAALDGVLSPGGPAILPQKEHMEKEVTRTVSWCRRRYLSKGEAGNWFYWDVVPYTDMLLEDLGLRSHRKKSWVRDFFEPCYADDFRNLVAEYNAKYLR